MDQIKDGNAAPNVNMEMTYGRGHMGEYKGELQCSSETKKGATQQFGIIEGG